MINPILNFKSQGDGQPLLVIHGLFGSSRNWQSLSQQWAQDFRVISVDLRNHGDSFHAAEMNYAVMTEDVVNLMDHLDLDSPHVLGHSMGGKVAMTLCNAHPHRVNRLIVADIAPVSYAHSHHDLIQPILDLDLSGISRRKQADEALTPSIPDPGIRLFLLQNLVIVEGQAKWKLNWPVLNQSMSAITGFPDISDWSIANPALFLRGGLSDYVSPESWHLIHQHFPNARLSTIEKAGHWLHAEKPEQFYQSVLSFLQQ